MPDEFILKISSLAGILFVIALFISPYLKGDPTVRPLLSYSRSP
jgi:hypothetical protein